MTKMTVEFLLDCADWKKGAIETLDPRRAQKLARQGYVRIVETATAEATEHAEQVRPATRHPRTERRG
jgi:hypothetical protein